MYNLRVTSGLFCQGVDLRQYSRQIEGDLHEVENASILDCILTFYLAWVHNVRLSINNIMIADRLVWNSKAEGDFKILFGKCEAKQVYPEGLGEGSFKQ